MCNIGKPIEIVQVEPLNAPVPVPRRETEPDPVLPVAPNPPAVPVALPVGSDEKEERFAEASAEERSA